MSNPQLDNYLILNINIYLYMCIYNTLKVSSLQQWPLLKEKKNWDFVPEVIHTDDSFVKLEDMKWQSLEDENVDGPSNHAQNDGDIPLSTRSFVGSKGASNSNRQQVRTSELHQTQISNFETSSSSAKGRPMTLNKFTILKFGFEDDKLFLILLKL